MQTHNNANDKWLATAARCKFAIHDGNVLIGVSNDKGEGKIVPVPMPSYFGAVASDGEQNIVLRSIAAYVKANAEDADTVAKIMSGEFVQKRDTSNDVLTQETDRRFANLVANKVREKKATATEKEIDASVKLAAGSESGKAKLAEIRGEVIADASFTSARAANKGAAVEIAF